MKKRNLLLFVVLLGLCSCGGPYSKTAVKVGTPGTVAPPSPLAYQISIGDKISIKLFYNPDLNQEVTVQPDGNVSLLLVHEVKVLGLSSEELRKMLTQEYSKYLQQPELSVVVTEAVGSRFFVGGEVAKPSMERLTGPTTVLQAVETAGGFLPSARLDEVLVLRRGKDNKPFQIKVNAKNAMKGIDLSQDIYLKPYDIVLVPRSNIADVDLWVDQYIARTIGAVGGDLSLYYYATH